MSRLWKWGTVLLLALWIADLGRFVSDIFSEATPTTASVDLVAVLTGGQGRLKEALLAFRGGEGKYLLISGTSEESNLGEILRVNHVENFPPELRDRVLIDSHSLSTPDNVHEIVTLLLDKKLKSVKVITSNYHLPRTMKLLGRELVQRFPGEQDLQVFQLPVESPNFPRTGWWKLPISWQILLSEYFKNRLIF
jgi:uncharacterized SAM-binding protein YcdF (DUF218 family)